jgi:hypothetical protein
MEITHEAGFAFDATGDGVERDVPGAMRSSPGELQV